MQSPPPRGCEDRLVTQGRAGGQRLFPEVPGFAYYCFFEGTDKGTGTVAGELGSLSAGEFQLGLAGLCGPQSLKSCL